MLFGCSTVGNENNSDFTSDDTNEISDTSAKNNSSVAETEEEKDPTDIGKKTIVFFGDSVTEGYFELVYNQEQNGITPIKDTKAVYHNVLKERISQEYPDLEVEYINAGISGTASSHGIKRIQTDVIAYNPDIVVVCFGLNDIPAMTISEYVSFMEQIFVALKQNEIKIIYMTPNMYNTYQHADVGKMHWELAQQLANIQNSNKPDRYYAATIKKAEKHGCIVVDAYSEWKKLSSYGIDVTELLSNHLNHPTREMHKLFADMLYDDVVKMLFS